MTWWLISDFILLSFTDIGDQTTHQPNRGPKPPRHLHLVVFHNIGQHLPPVVAIRDGKGGDRGKSQILERPLQTNRWPKRLDVSCIACGPVIYNNVHISYKVSLCPWWRAWVPDLPDLYRGALPPPCGASMTPPAPRGRQRSHTEGAATPVPEVCICICVVNLTVSARIARLSLRAKNPDTGPVWWYLKQRFNSHKSSSQIKQMWLYLHATFAYTYILAGCPSQPQ